MSIGEGTVLGDRYAVGDVLGRGGMADVFRADDRVLGREVAVKVMRGVEGSPNERARFEAEARTLARLSHPGLVTVLDAGSDEGREFLVMELVDGPPLSERLGRPLPEAMVADIGRQVAEALAYAHAHGVIHRDVKPGNVLLGRDGRVKLADFGIARLVDQTSHHTQAGTTIGSPAYLAPEQVSGGQVTPAADVYSLGLVLLEALTGRREYEGPATEAAMARLHRAPAIPEELPAPWRELLRDMTAMDPAARPRAGDVATRIPEPGSAARTAVLTAPTVLPEQTQRLGGVATTGLGSLDRAPRRLLPFPVVVGLAALACLALLVVLVVLASSSDDPPAESEAEIPDGVPTRLEEPLIDLHEAVEGSPE